MSDGDNKHPADELAEIRLKLRAWKEREEELRLLIIEMLPHERKGKKYTATVRGESRSKLNIPGLEEAFGDLSRFYTSTNFTMVRTKRKETDD